MWRKFEENPKNLTQNRTKIEDNPKILEKNSSESQKFEENLK